MQIHLLVCLMTEGHLGAHFYREERRSNHSQRQTDKAVWWPGPAASWGLAKTTESRFGGCFVLLLHVWKKAR